MTQSDDPKDETETEAPSEPSEGAPPRRRRREGPKERVLHTRVPEVLDQELKKLATNLRVPVSNVVRAILEDALDAVDAVGTRAEGELRGFVTRLEKQRDVLRRSVRRSSRPPPVAEPKADDARPAEPEGCQGDPSAVEGAYAFQPVVLAAETPCTACGAALPRGAMAHRALFDDPARRAFLGPGCRLLPDAKERE